MVEAVEALEQVGREWPPVFPQEVAFHAGDVEELETGDDGSERKKPVRAADVACDAHAENMILHAV